MTTEYPVRTLAQMAVIPLEARKRFLSELPAMLDTAANILSLQMIVGEDAEVILGEPTWVDDGATNATVNIDFQDSDGNSFAKSTTTFDHAASGTPTRRAETSSGSVGEADGGPTPKGDAQ